MGQWYQNEDRLFIDYQMYDFEGVRLRGPKNTNDRYIAYLGAAQTFGRFCEKPFPTIIGEKLNMGTLNFGSGGAGPSFFTRQEKIIEAVNQAELVVVQVMSGRSTSNSLFKSLRGGSTGYRLSDNSKIQSDQLFRELLSGEDPRGFDRVFMKDLVKETQENYKQETITLLNSITPPKILFWFSVKHPKDNEFCYSGLNWFENMIINYPIIYIFFRKRYHIKPLGSLGSFPQLVDENVINSIKSYADYYSECVSDRGLPQIIKNEIGEIVRTNNYYPSPEMHLDAAEAILPICRDSLEIR